VISSFFIKNTPPDVDNQLPLCQLKECSCKWGDSIYQWHTAVPETFDKSAIA